jgi:indole-3-glycerol phosphate synthase
VAEVPCKGLHGEAQEQLAQRATLLAQQGMDALAVHTDADETPCGLRDLFAVVRAVPKTPVLRRDWFIHPLQVIAPVLHAAADSCS